MSAKYQAPMSLERKPLHTLLPLEQPLSLFIDPCDICNFKCNFCFQYHTKHIGQVMERKLFEKIASDMQEFDNPFKMVHLNGHGEPLLNPDIVEFVKILKQKMIAEKVSITTNASLLTKTKSQELVDAGLDKVEISIYGLNQEEYYKFSNVKILFDDLYENIKYFYSIRGKCHIHIKIAGDYFSEDEKQRFIDLFGAVADTIYIDHAINSWPGINVTNSGEHMYDLNGAKICPMPFYQMLIHSNGKVSPCCPEYQQKLIIGDINRESLKNIWTGNDVQKLRKNILQDMISDDAVCSYCEYPKCGATVDITPYRDELLKLY